MDSMCRLCLTTANGEDIFENGLDKVIKDAFWIRLREKPNWPSRACETCTNFLKEIKAFRVKIERSQEHLEQLELQVVVKAEPLTEIKDEVEDRDDASDDSSVSLKWEMVDLPSPESSEQEGDDFSDESSVSFSMKWETEDTSFSERANQAHDEVRSPSPPIVSAKKRRTQNRKPKSKQLRAPLEKQLKKLNLLNCNKCPFEASSLEELRIHCKDQHETVFYVSCCNTKYLNLQIYEHMEYHLDENRFKCEICQKKMKSKTQLVDHRRIAHPKPEDFKFKCETCGKLFIVPSRLKHHVENYHSSPKICKICGKESASAHTLKVHINLCHSERKTQECDICGKQVFAVKNHKRSVHGPKVTIKCKHCGKEIQKQCYAQHVKVVHQIGAKVYECNLCGADFKKLTAYKDHLDIHSGVKHDCRFCKHQAITKTSLRRHMETKHAEEYLEFRKGESIKVRTKGASSKCP